MGMEKFYTARTSNGPDFIVDIEFVDLVAKYTWHFQRYPRTTINGKIIRLHNLLFGKAPKGLEWDHIDQDTLNNCRNNLRLVNHSEQMRNKRTPKNNTSGVKGVYWHKSECKWIAQLKINNKIKHLGYFKDKNEAIAARQAAEQKYLSKLL
jgi:hypothetical protein